jgi:cyclase
VKGQRFDSWRSVGHALQAAKIHAARHVDELCILDIGATPEGRGPDFDALTELTRECFCPITVGGGVRSVEDVRQLLAAGADKVAICAAAMKRPELVSDCARKFGTQALVVVLDIDIFDSVRNGPDGTPQDIATFYQGMGAGEILLQSIDRDGTMSGYDIELICSVSESVDIPVIACGGCSGYEDMANAIKAGASAVAAGALFQFTDATPKGAAEYLAMQGIETRVVLA